MSTALRLTTNRFAATDGRQPTAAALDLVWAALYAEREYTKALVGPSIDARVTTLAVLDAATEALVAFVVALEARAGDPSP